MLKKILVMALSLLMMVLFTACGQNPPATEKPAENPATTENAENPPAESSGKILVAFFSRAGDNYETGVIEKGNTKIVAEMISEKLGADLFEITPINDYPADYRTCTEVAKAEQESNARPEIISYVENLQDYDTIFLGYPIWWSDFPMVVYTFLENQDFNGKTIIPFCTSAGTYMTNKENQIPEIAKGSIVREGIGIKGKECQENPNAVLEKINAWLAGLGY
ncbi:MAG: NAD(P)H-dependent oxidoreductase [Selenomonadaceae bacterium]|nr:NAD(P)H-dependent oxidoreductase [Selenomonadaceae bacterium]